MYVALGPHQSAGSCTAAHELPERRAEHCAAARDHRATRRKNSRFGPSLSRDVVGLSDVFSLQVAGAAACPSTPNTTRRESGTRRPSARACDHRCRYPSREVPRVSRADSITRRVLVPGRRMRERTVFSRTAGQSATPEPTAFPLLEGDSRRVRTSDALSMLSSNVGGEPHPSVYVRNQLESVPCEAPRATDEILCQSTRTRSCGFAPRYVVAPLRVAELTVRRRPGSSYLPRSRSPSVTRCCTV